MANQPVEPCRAYPSNQMLLYWPYHGSNFIHVMMPENLGGRRESENRKNHVFHGWGQEESYHYQRIGNNAWEHTYEEAAVLHLRGRWQRIDAGMALELELTNNSKEAWHEVDANVCVSLAGAPQFADPAVERTFYSAADGMKQVIRKGTYEWAHGFIAVAAKDGEATIAYGWHTGGKPHVGDPGLACLHANPYYGSIDAGQSVTHRGVIYTMPGTPEDAYRRFLDEGIASQKNTNTK